MTSTGRSYEGLRDLVVQEQFMECCPRQLQVYLKEKATTQLDELAAYAETYTETHGRPFASLCRGGASEKGQPARHQPPARRTSPHGSATACFHARYAAAMPVL